MRAAVYRSTFEPVKNHHRFVSAFRESAYSLIRGTLSVSGSQVCERIRKLGSFLNLSCTTFMFEFMIGQMLLQVVKKNSARYTLPKRSFSDIIFPSWFVNVNGLTELWTGNFTSP